MGTNNASLRPRWPVLVVVTVLVAGCGGGKDDAPASGETEARIVQAGAPGEPSRVVSADEAAAAGETKHTQADVDFMRGMIHHHAQALLMTRYARENLPGRDVGLIARRIEISQESEIELMQKWLFERYEPAPQLHLVHGHAHGVGYDPAMPGMVSKERLDALRDARGHDFDVLFLQSMIYHHEGALTMVSELYDSAGGMEPNIDAFARHVVADQQIEIERMQQLLAAMEED
jgi:uncharacterized protein (DUF305 family)